MSEPAMVEGISFSELAAHCVRLLETQGDTAIHVVKTLLGLVKNRDLFSVWAAINEIVPDVQKIIAAIKAEFGL